MRDIPGFEGLYKASRDGKIWSCVNGRFLKTSLNLKGYTQLGLWKKKRRGSLVHRLVALTYIPNQKNLPQINHKNGVKTDNRVDNLEWCSNRQNFVHAFENGLWSNKVNPVDVLSIRKLLVEKKLTQREIGNQFGLTQSMVSRISTGSSWSENLLAV